MILLISKKDYARMGYLLAKSLNEIGMYAISITEKKIYHDEQSIVYKNQNELLKFVSQASVVIWMHSILTPINKALQNQTKVFVFHGGTNYRKKYKKQNKIFNNIVDASIIQTGELLGLGAVNEQWLLPPVDTKLIQPEFGIHKNITIAHYPSNKIRPEHDIKGTLSINEVIKDISSIQNLNFNYRFKNAYDTTPRVSWKRNLKRMSNCDIYIESLNIDSTSDNQHDWSLTALEAAALGKIVITNFRNRKRYKKEYGNCELIIANNRKQLKDVLIKLIQSPREVLIKKQQKTREWVETYHSLKAIGLRFKNIIQNTHKRISNPVIIPNHKIPNSSLMKNKRLHTSTRIHNNTLPPSFQPPKKHKQGRAAG